MVTQRELVAALYRLTAGDEAALSESMSHEVAEHAVSVRAASYGVTREFREVVVEHIVRQLPGIVEVLHETGMNCCVAHILQGGGGLLFEDGFRAAIEVLRARGVDVGDLRG